MTISGNHNHKNIFALAIVAESPQRRRPQGLRERQSDRRKLLTATMRPAANDCVLVAESATAKPERPNKNKNLLYNEFDFFHLDRLKVPDEK